MKQDEEKFIDEFLAFLEPKMKWAKWRHKRYEQTAPRRRRIQNFKLHIRDQYVIPFCFAVIPKKLRIESAIDAYVQPTIPWFSLNGQERYIYYSRYLNKLQVAHVNIHEDVFETYSWKEAIVFMHEKRERVQQEQAQRKLDYLLRRRDVGK